MELEEILADPEVIKDIDEAVKEKRFEFILRKNKRIGFYTWVETDKAVYIGNFYIHKNLRNKNNLLFIRDYLQKKFPEAELFYWHNKDGFVYYKKGADETLGFVRYGGNQPPHS